MFLITFDVIDSRKMSTKLADIINIDEYLSDLCKEYSIYNKNIQIHDGDQIRVLVKKYLSVVEIILDVLSFLISNDIKARVFISCGNIETKGYNNLSEADGDMFHKNKKLEETSKNDLNYYKEKQCSIRYLGYENSALLDILFLSVSKLCLKKADNIQVIFKKHFKGFTQKQLADELDISQTAIFKKLKASELRYLNSAVIEINKLLEKEEQDVL